MALSGLGRPIIVDRVISVRAAILLYGVSTCTCTQTHLAVDHASAIYMCRSNIKSLYNVYFHNG